MADRFADLTVRLVQILDTLSSVTDHEVRFVTRRCLLPPMGLLSSVQSC